MKEKQYLSNRDEVFEECNLKTSNKIYNCHHNVERFDKKRHLVPNDFELNNRRNLTPLKITVHDQLHELMDNDPYFKRNISTRIYLANMAFNGDLCDVPDRLYFTDPVSMMRLKPIRILIWDRRGLINYIKDL